jgi:hypothetical protein
MVLDRLCCYGLSVIMYQSCQLPWQSFSYAWAAAGWGEKHMFMFDWSTLMIPQEATLDSLHTLS